MKSYRQYSESLDDIRLKEWERLDEGTKKEIVKQFAEENNIELNEENLEEVSEAVATALLTSPIWAPALKTAAVAGGAWALSKAPGLLKNRQQEKENEKFLNTGSFESSKNIPKSSRTDSQRDQTFKNDKVTTNNTPDPSNNKPPKKDGKLKQFSKFLNTGNKYQRFVKKGAALYAGGFVANQVDRARRALTTKQDGVTDVNKIKTSPIK